MSTSPALLVDEEADLEPAAFLQSPIVAEITVTLNGSTVTFTTTSTQITVTGSTIILAPQSGMTPPVAYRLMLVPSGFTFASPAAEVFTGGSQDVGVLVYPDSEGDVDLGVVNNIPASGTARAMSFDLFTQGPNSRIVSMRSLDRTIDPTIVLEPPSG